MASTSSMVFAAPSFMTEMGLTEHDIQRRVQIAGLTSEDLARIRAIRELVERDVGRHADAFFDYLASLTEAKRLFERRDVLERARALKREHLIAMVQGDYGRAYVEERVELAILYSKASLEPRVFLAAFRCLMRSVGAAISARFAGQPGQGFEHYASFEKIAFFDVSLIIDVIVFERERIIHQQQEAIQELSTPVLPVRERTLLLPIIGVIDTARARLLTDSLLRAIRANRARVAVMDVTGVATIDSKTANHLLQTVAAARLMGASVIITGLSPEVAQALVAIGINLERLTTVGDLRGGMELAEEIVRMRTVPRDDVRDEDA